MTGFASPELDRLVHELRALRVYRLWAQGAGRRGVAVMRTMRRWCLSAIGALLLAGVLAPPAAAADARPGSVAAVPAVNAVNVVDMVDAIEVVDGGWGGGTPDEIRKVIAAVAGIMPARAGGGASPPMLRVRHRFGGPRIEYQRDRDGRIVVFLSARDDRWYQYVYQFAHEYCHLLSHFERKRQGDDIVRDHQWFEEALCETASLHAVRRLAQQWCDAGTDPLLGLAAPQLALYARQLLGQAHRRLDAQTDMAQWYTRHHEALRSQPYLRELNELAAAQLLPLFEKDPDRWAALASLNPVDLAPGTPFPDFLARWRAAAPASQQALVAEIQTLFGFTGPATAAEPAPLPGITTRVAVSAAPSPPDKGPGCGN